MESSKLTCKTGPFRYEGNLHMIVEFLAKKEWLEFSSHFKDFSREESKRSYIIKERGDEDEKESNSGVANYLV